MRFNDFDKKMRVYEQSLDQTVLPDMYIVVRLDGRGFTKLTKEVCGFEAPFDSRFRDLMVHTVKALMESGPNIVYGFTQSDEISLLFARDDNTFNRKVRKLVSVLAGEASAVFSMELGKRAVFDARVIPLPNAERVADVFLWRQEDAHRNSLNGYCYWTLRKEGLSVRAATGALKGRGDAYKNELLFKHGINYNDLPAWQKCGIGLWREQYTKEALNPITGESVQAVRRRITVCEDLPRGEKYADLIKRLIADVDTVN